MSHIARCCLFSAPVVYASMVCWLFGLSRALSGASVSSKVEQLHQQLKERILVLDGGMGTMIRAIV